MNGIPQTHQLMFYRDLFEDGGFSTADSKDSCAALEQAYPDRH